MAEEPTNGGVRVTLKDVYTKLEDVSDTLTRLVERETFAQHRVDDHETRIRAVERRVWAVPSFAVLVAVASLVVTVIRLG